MTTKQLSDLDRIKQAPLGVKGSIRADEKISVAYPIPLGSSKTLMAEFTHFASDYLQVAGPNPSGGKKERSLVLVGSHKLRGTLSARDSWQTWAQAELHRILARARRGFTILLYSREKDWPCHRFVLLDILRAMAEQREGLAEVLRMAP
jgi:hypothetical protein